MVPTPAGGPGRLGGPKPSPPGIRSFSCPERVRQHRAEGIQRVSITAQGSVTAAEPRSKRPSQGRCFRLAPWPCGRTGRWGEVPVAGRAHSGSIPEESPASGHESPHPEQVRPGWSAAGTLGFSDPAARLWQRLGLRRLVRWSGSRSGSLAWRPGCWRSAPELPDRHSMNRFPPAFFALGL